MIFQDKYYISHSYLFQTSFYLKQFYYIYRVHFNKTVDQCSNHSMIIFSRFVELFSVSKSWQEKEAED